MLVINAVLYYAYGAWWCWSCMIYTVSSHTQARAFIPAIHIHEWRSLTSSLTDSGGDRQTPRYRSVSAGGRCGDLPQSEPRTHAHWMKARSSHLHRCRLRKVLAYTSCRGISAATSGDSLVCLYSTSTYIWITCGIPGSNVAWFIVSLYWDERCLWLAELGYYNKGEK